MKIYGIKNCDTMQKAFAALEARKVADEFHDYRKDGVPPGKLRERKLLIGFDPAEYTRL